MHNIAEALEKQFWLVESFNLPQQTGQVRRFYLPIKPDLFSTKALYFILAISSRMMHSQFIPLLQYSVKINE